MKAEFDPEIIKSPDFASRNNFWYARRRYLDENLTDVGYEGQLWALTDYKDELERLRLSTQRKLESIQVMLSMLAHKQKVTVKEGDKIRKVTAKDLIAAREKAILYLQFEEIHLRDTQFFFYAHSLYPKVQEIMKGEVDLFIKERLDMDFKKGLRHDLLFLSNTGGQRGEEGLYRYNLWMGKILPWDEQQKEIAYLAELGLIKIHKHPEDKSNLTDVGEVVLEIFDKVSGPSIAAERYQDYMIERGAPAFHI